MNEKTMNSNGIESLLLARNYVKEGKFTLAIEKYFAYLVDTPGTLWDTNSLKEFINLICDMKIFVTLQSIVEEIWNAISMSMSLFPEEWRLLNITADIYLQYGCTDKFAENVFEAYQIARKNGSTCLAVEKKLLRIMWKEVSRWHFRMLNGKVRNSSYKKAICKALEKGYTTALDIGAGCGLLSLYLGTHPAKPNITMFESNKILYDLAIMNLQKYCPEITVDGYKSDSKDVKEIKSKSNLLVTEIFDVAVFGEGILCTLLHSLKYHMNTSNYCIIPAKVTIFVTGLSCKSLDQKFRLHNKIPSLNIENNVNVIRHSEDPYDAENILGEKFEILTKTTRVIEVNFYDKKMLEAIYKNEWNECIILRGLKNGVIDCLVVWFDLHLHDDIVISTNPFHEKNEPCWEQAIFHCPIPLKIDKGSELSLSVNIMDEHLHFESTNQNLQCSNWFSLEENSLSFLNDEKWTKCLTSLTETITGKEQLTIFDFSCFPLVGLLLAKKGHQVVYVYKNQQNNHFIQYLIKNNDIKLELFNFVHSDDFPACVLGQSRIDYVFYEPCDIDGTLNPSPLDNIIFKKFNAKSLLNNVILHFKLVFSPYLDYCNRVSAENVEPFEDLATSINTFSGTEHPYLPHDFPHENMTNEQRWNMKQDIKNILPLKVLKDGRINGILTWFTLEGSGGIKYSTEKSTYFNRNVVLLSERKVERNECLNINCQYEEGGYFKLEICEEEWIKNNFETYNKYNHFIEHFFSLYRDHYVEPKDNSNCDDCE